MPISISLSCKNLSSYERKQVEDYLQEKIARMKRLVSGEARLTVRAEKYTKKSAYNIELFLKDSSYALRASEDDHTIREAIDFAVDKLVRQAEKARERTVPSHHKYPRSKPWRERWEEAEETLGTALQDGVLEQKEFFRAIEPLVRPAIAFIQHELVNQTGGRELDDDLNPEGIVDDAVLVLWEDRNKRPQGITLRQWFYRVALGLLNDRIKKTVRDNAQRVSMDEPMHESGEAFSVSNMGDEVKDFWQPDAFTNLADTLEFRKGQGLQPSQRKLYRLLLRALVNLKAPARQAFILHFREGFSADEIALIQRRSSSMVEKEIRDAVALLKKRIRGMIHE